MAVLQIDAINTVIRSHYMPLFSRLGAYDREQFDARLFDQQGQRPNRRQFYEYWGHECSLLPIQTYPLFHWRRNDAACGAGIYKPVYELARDNAALVKKISSTVKQRGVLSYSDLESDGRGPGMWEWSKSKQALEYLFWTGELASAGRSGFKRLYTTPENAIPAALLQARPSQRPSHRLDDQMALIEIAAQALGVAAETDLRDYFRLSAADSKACVASLVEAGRLLAVRVESWQQTAYVCPATRIPHRIQACTLLTPFDPVVWCRERAERLFGFRYRIEIYVPAAKRNYGYWVMPFLLGDSVVARVDLKADRENSQLLVKGAWGEAEAVYEDVAPALLRALFRLARWLNLEHIKIGRKGDLCKTLKRANEAI